MAALPADRHFMGKNAGKMVTFLVISPRGKVRERKERALGLRTGPKKENAMSTFDNSVSIHPYFQVKEGKMEEAKKMIVGFGELVSKNEPRENCLFYNFTIKDDVICCREAYANAEAVLAHLGNCGEALGPFFQIADLIRIELHGPAAELDKLKEAFADFKPEYFESECGIGR